MRPKVTTGPSGAVPGVTMQNSGDTVIVSNVAWRGAALMFIGSVAPCCGKVRKT